MAGSPRTVSTNLRGGTLLAEASLNKGPGFPADERRRFGIDGLLPPAIETLDQQVARRRQEFDRLHDDLERHIFLRAVQDDNEVLFYALLDRYLAELLPIVYTPTVGTACQQFSRIYRRPHGLFLTYPDRDRMGTMLDAARAEHQQWCEGDIDVIVVTDGERILGLGDQGIGGMGIPIGKLSLYTAAGGIDPRRTLPVVLDCGTNNRELLDDPLYLGWRHERITGTDYDEFVDRFVEEVKVRFPTSLLQWEDFAQHNAAPILARHRGNLLSFNDDIQGTAAVALAAIQSGVNSASGSAGGARRAGIADQRVVILGAGSAGTGIAEMVRNAMIEAGLSEAEAVARLHLIDRNGLLHAGRDDLSDYQRPFAQPAPVSGAEAGSDSGLESGPGLGLAEVVDRVAPTVLIGVSGQPGLFTAEIVRSMAARVERPIIMPMSNPTSRAEATPEDLLAWTDGRALVATGSPFEPVVRNDRRIVISQANNVYVFPGIGLGAVAAKATEVTDSMMVAAAVAVAEEADADGSDPDAGLLPPIDRVRAVSESVAMAVARAAVVADVAPAATDDELRDAIRSHLWWPDYPTLVPTD